MPDREVYVGAAALLDYQPTEIMMVAAHPNDLKAAHACGLRTAFVSRPLEGGAGHSASASESFDVMASDAFARGASFQFYAVVLVNVCYRLYAEAEFAGPHETTTWPPHAYHDVFNRALERGQWFYTPCLGWKEFAPDYVGPVRPETRVCESENHELPTMLRMVFDQPQAGQVKPTFSRKLRVEKGVLVYAE